MVSWETETRLGMCGGAGGNQQMNLFIPWALCEQPVYPAFWPVGGGAGGSDKEDRNYTRA